MDNYLLVARDKKGNGYRVINLDESWFIDGGTKGKMSSLNSLEAIDLVTTQFRDRDQMVKRLVSRGYIENDNVDIFIAQKNKQNGKSYIRFDEVLYGGSVEGRKKSIRDIAKCSLAGNGLDPRGVQDLLEDIVLSVYSSNDLYSMILQGDTNLSRDFAESLREVPRYEDLPYELITRGKIKAGSYSDIRNVAEVILRFRSFPARREDDDRFTMNQEFVLENLEERKALIPALSKTFDELARGKQATIFDVDVAKKEVAPVVEKPEVSEETKRKPLTLGDMRREVFRVLHTLPINAFLYDGKKFHFNEGAFRYPLADDEKKRLRSLLTGNMPKYFMDYAQHRQRAQYCSDSGEYYEASELRGECERDERAISRCFKNNGRLVNTFKWCMLYEACRRREKMYSGGEQDLGMVPKAYGKK